MCNGRVVQGHNNERESAIDQWLPWDSDVSISQLLRRPTSSLVEAVAGCRCRVGTVGRVERLDKKRRMTKDLRVLVQYRRKGSTKISGKMWRRSVLNGVRMTGRGGVALEKLFDDRDLSFYLFIVVCESIWTLAIDIFLHVVWILIFLINMFSASQETTLSVTRNGSGGM